VRVAIIVVALLLVRALVDQLPMLRHARPIVVTAALPLDQQQFLMRIQAQQLQSGQMFPDDQMFGWLPGYIQPVSLANAAIDTLTFIAILLGAADLSRQIRRHAGRLPELGTMTFLVILSAITGLAYRSYAAVAMPLLGIDYVFYDWLFLILGIAPILTAVLIGYRKLDVITDIVLQVLYKLVSAAGAAHQTHTTNCQNCGKALTPGGRFCAACGTPASGDEARPAFCASCGARNDGLSGRCTNCGASLAVPT
jgi:hypothetical protein